MQHLDLDHKESDKHFGSFDMLKNSFDYKFKIDNIEYHFLGIKEPVDDEIYF